MAVLEIKRWAERDGNGLSAWMIRRTDRAVIHFPNQRELNRIFRRGLKTKPSLPLKVLFRHKRPIVVGIPVGLKKVTRDVFLVALEKHMQLS